MDKRFVLALILFAVVLSGIAQAQIATTASLATINDTYSSYPFNDTTNCGAEGNPYISHGAETSLYPLCNGGSKYSWHAMLKYNMSAVLTKVITAGNFSVYRTNNVQCPYRIISLFSSQNNTWLDSDVVQSLASYQTVVSSLNTNTTNGYHSKAIDVTIASVMRGLYNASSSDLVSFQTSNDNTNCANVGDKIYLSSMEGGYAPLLEFELADYQTGQSIFTFNIFNRVAYFDFESQTGSFSPFTEADFSYNIDTNTITPYVSMTPVIAQQDTNNTLFAIACNQETGYTTAPYPSVNIPTGNYHVLCFNLASQHGNRNFYGAIKVLNNTADTFAFYWAEFSPQYTTFSTPIVSPTVPEGSRNITISWTSTQSSTTGLRYRYTLNNVTSAYATIFNGSFAVTHSVTIPSALSFGGADYDYYVYGSMTDDSSFSSPTYSFHVTGFQETIPDITEGITIIVTNEANVPQRARVSIDGISPISTTQILSAGSPYGFVQAITFFGFPNAKHNITVSADTKATQKIEINVLSQPFFQTVKLLPSYACLPVEESFTNVSCIVNMQRIISTNVYPELNITAFYCQFDPSGCTLFNSNGTCVQSPMGSWKGYACLDAFFPAGFPVNSSVPSGQIPTDQQSQTGIIADPIASALGVSQASALAGLFLLLVGILSVWAGVYVKSGLVIVIGVLAFVFAFTFWGFIPIWIFLIFAVISAFLIAKFLRQGMTPQ